MPKVLIVEDEKSIASMYQFKLSQSGYSVACAYDGEQGLQLAKQYEPDVILLDLRMPRMTGDEMLKKMRETDWGSNIRVVVLTNISKDEAPSSLRFLNVDRYIVKASHTPSEVTRLVDELLERA